MEDFNGSIAMGIEICCKSCIYRFIEETHRHTSNSPHRIDHSFGECFYEAVDLGLFLLHGSSQPLHVLEYHFCEMILVHVLNSGLCSHRLGAGPASDSLGSSENVVKSRCCLLLITRLTGLIIEQLSHEYCERRLISMCNTVHTSKKRRARSTSSAIVSVFFFFFFLCFVDCRPP